MIDGVLLRWSSFRQLLSSLQRTSEDQFVGSICELLSSDLSTDSQWGLSLGFGWATQGQSVTCPKTIPALSWQYPLGHPRAERCPSLRLCALWSRFSSRSSWYLASFIVSSILTSLPVPAAEKHSHNILLPPPCFIVGRKIASAWCSPKDFCLISPV